MRVIPSATAHVRATSRASCVPARQASRVLQHGRSCPSHLCTASAQDATSSSSSSADIAVTAKWDIERLAGAKHGLDKSPEEKKAVSAVAERLIELKHIDELDLTGSRWKLVFTESTASSSGKVGPFVGRTEQEFPADKPGQYINWLYLGPVTASLLADYEQTAKDRIDVSFVNLTVKAGPFRWTKEFANRGTWDSLYIDNDFRVFRANKKNLFILKRMA